MEPNSNPIMLPPRLRPRPDSLVMIVTDTRAYNNSFMGSMNARTTLNVTGVEVRDGVRIGHAAIQMQGPRINGVIARGHWLEVPRNAIRQGGRVKRVTNLSTGEQVYTQFRFFDWFH
jgi:hypothetical protein